MILKWHCGRTKNPVILTQNSAIQGAQESEESTRLHGQRIQSSTAAPSSPESTNKLKRFTSGCCEPSPVLFWYRWVPVQQHHHIYRSKDICYANMTHPTKKISRSVQTTRPPFCSRFTSVCESTIVPSRTVPPVSCSQTCSVHHQRIVSIPVELDCRGANFFDGLQWRYLR